MVLEFKPEVADVQRMLSLLFVHCKAGAVYDMVMEIYRETTENKALYFSDSDSLVYSLKQNDSLLKQCAENVYEIANRRYKWNIIAKQYEELY